MENLPNTRNLLICARANNKETDATPLPRLALAAARLAKRIVWPNHTVSKKKQ